MSSAAILFDALRVNITLLITGNKCFYMNTNKLNWTAARDHCREFGKGYDIASIEDIYEHGMCIEVTHSVL